MARLLAIFMICTQFLNPSVFASGSPPSIATITRRTLAIAHIEGMIAVLNAMVSVSSHTKDIQYNVDEYRRLYDFFDYLEPIQKRLAAATQILTDDPFASVRLSRLMRDISKIALEEKKELDGEDPDDHSDLVERLDNAKTAVAEILNRVQGFLDTLKAETPEIAAAISAAASASSDPAVMSLTQANGNNLAVLRNVTVLRAMLIQLDVFTAFENDEYENNRDDDEQYAEYYTMVSYLNTVASVMENLAAQLHVDGNAAGLLADSVAELKKLTTKLDRKYLSNSNIGTDDEDWRELFAELKAAVQEVRDDLGPMVEMFERRAASEMATLETVIARINENPGLFQDAIRAAAANYQAETTRLETEIGTVRAAVATANSARATAEQAAMEADRDRLSAIAELTEAKRENGSVERAVARLRQEMETREAALAQINGSVPLLEALVARVFGNNQYGVLAPTTIQYVNVASQIKKHSRFLLLQESLQTRIDALLTLMKTTHQQRFAQTLAQVGAPGEFNLSARLVISNPQRKWYHKIQADIGFIVTIEGMGVKGEIDSSDDGLRTATFKISRKTGDFDDAELTRFIEQVLPEKIAAVLSGANPAVPGMGRMTDVVRQTCAEMLAQYATTIAPLKQTDGVARQEP